MRTVNVLVTAASRRVPLVRAFRRAVEQCGRGRVITSDVNPMSPALYFGHKHHIVPLTTDPKHMQFIRSICEIEGINLIVPTIDDELPIFGRHRADLESAGVRVAVSPLATSETCNDKFRMYEFCRQHGFETPQTFLAKDIDGARLKYPAVVKPRFGRGSVDVFTVRNRKHVELFAEYVPDAIVQEFVEGTEFTVDVLADFDGRILSIVPRERLVIRAGVSDRGVTRRHYEVMEFAESLAKALGIVGPANIQCKWNGRHVSLIEVNPRFSGGIPLTIAAGADFPKWLVERTAGRAVASRIGDFEDGLTMMSFEDSIFARQNEMAALRSDNPRPLARSASGMVN